MARTGPIWSAPSAPSMMPHIIHSDWSPYDSLTEDWILDQVTHQATFNLCLAPVKGGRIIVHDLQWTLKFRDPTSYGYGRELIEGKAESVCPANTGVRCGFFSARQEHARGRESRFGTDAGAWAALHYRPGLALGSYGGRYYRARRRPKLMFWP